MSFNVTYSFNNGAVTGTAIDYETLYNAIHADDYTQITLSGTIEGDIGYACDEATEEMLQTGLFDSCYFLESLDVSNLDTSDVTNMNWLFYNCKSLTSLDLSNWNTSNVINMAGMFDYCESLESLDVSNLDTSNVTNMNNMFYDCSSLTSVDLSNLNTSNVTDMSYMFYDCKYLESLDVSNWDTSNVTDMSYMFYNCYELEYIKVSSLFNTTKVTLSSSMFYDCTKLPNYDSLYIDKTNAYIGGYFIADPEVGNDFVYQQHIKRNNQLCKIYPRISPDFKMIRIVTNAEYNALGSSVETDNVLYIIRG